MVLSFSLLGTGLAFGAETKAKRVRITDAGNYYTGTEVETALQEVGAGTTLDSRYLLNTGDQGDGNYIIDQTSTEALLVRSNADGEDVFTVDTQTGYGIEIGGGRAGRDYTLKFDGENSDFLATWDEDNDYLNVNDDILMANAEKVYFRATSQYINSAAVGRLDLGATTSIDLNQDTLVEGNLIVDDTNVEALLIRKNADAGNLFAVDTQTGYGTVTIGGGIDNADYILKFDGHYADGIITWMEDEDYFKFSDDIMLVGGENIILDTTTGTKIGTTTSQLLGFYNITPVNQPDALTTQLTSITHTAPTPDYALQDLVQNTGFGFATKDEGNTALSVILNLQTRMQELENRLEELGLTASN